MFFIITQLTILLIILGLLYLLTWFLPTDSPWSPWWSTNTEISRVIGKVAHITKKDVFYELGSGTGTTVTVIAKEFGAECVGIESDTSRVLWSRWKVKALKQWSNRAMKQYGNVTIIKDSFFNVDLSSASVVYLYLVPRVITKLQTKLLKELTPGTRIVSYVYPIDYLPLVKKDPKHHLFVYTIPASHHKD